MDSVTCANVIEIIGKTGNYIIYIAISQCIINYSLGSRGGITQVKVQFATPSGNRTLVRNVKGPVRIGDRLGTIYISSIVIYHYLALLECEREARRLR